MSRTKKKEGAVRGKTTNRIINILLVLGCLTILFPLYMTVIIAFKKPSEMTNDVAGALAFPQKWSFENFAEAMRVTDFWHSLGNSLLITGVTVVLCILIHSLAGYLIGRKMKQRKIFKISYYYIVSGMFVPFAVLMMPLVKETAQLGIANRFGVIVLYVVFFMPMNVLLYSGYLTKYPVGIGRGSLRGWCKHMENLLENCISNYETNACDSCSSDSTRHMERCNDTTCNYVRLRKRKYTAIGTVDLPDTVWNKL